MADKNRSSVANGIRYGGFLQVTNKFFQPEIFLRLTGNEFKVLTYLTFLRFTLRDQEGRIRATYSYLENGTGLSEGTLKRVMRSLARKHFVRVLEVNRKRGNLYLVYTVLLHQHGGKQSDHFDLSEPNQSDHFDPTVRSFCTDKSRQPGTQTDQNDLQGNTKTLIGTVDPDASRQWSPNGQIEIPPEPPQGENGVLSDRMRNNIRSVIQTGSPLKSELHR